MTDENDPKPMKKTSAVPLRKETVRVTLKATPDGGNGKGLGVVPAPAPTIALNTPGGAPSVPAPAPTVKLQTGAPTPTAPLQMAPSSKTPEPAPTVKLDTPGTSTPTGASSQPLPKATVQLQKSQPMSAATGPADTLSVAPTIVADNIDDAAASREEGSAAVLSVIALVAALIVLGVQLGTANIWVNDESQENPGWGRLFE